MAIYNLFLYSKGGIWHLPTTIHTTYPSHVLLSPLAIKKAQMASLYLIPNPETQAYI